MGIDHVGHAHRMNHPQMRKKIKETDDFLKELFSKIDNETVVLIHGDHGMTFEGDHGGSSNFETSTGGFAYIRSGFHPLCKKYHQLMDAYPSHEQSLSLINLAPTLSWLLGLPIPFSSIGRIIPDLYTNNALGNISETDFLCRVMHDYFVNIKQVQTYIEEAQEKFTKYKELDYIDFRTDVNNITLAYNWLETQHREIGDQMSGKQRQQFIEDACVLVLRMKAHLHNVYQITRVMMSFDYFMMWSGILLLLVCSLATVVSVVYVGAIARLGNSVDFPETATVGQGLLEATGMLFRLEVMIPIIIAFFFMISLHFEPMHFLGVIGNIAGLYFLIKITRQWLLVRLRLRQIAKEYKVFISGQHWLALENYYNPLFKQPGLTIVAIMLNGYHIAVLLSVTMMRKECNRATNFPHLIFSSTP